MSFATDSEDTVLWTGICDANSSGSQADKTHQEWAGEEKCFSGLILLTFYRVIYSPLI